LAVKRNKEIFLIGDGLVT